jgi:triosephosphate isomerase
VGADIKAGMTVPEGAPLSEYKTTFLYKKDGVIKEFTTDNYPWNDSTWVWVETRQELVKKGFEPLIHDFSITSGDGLDLTDSILTSPGYTFLLISTELRNADKDGILKASTLAEESAKHGYGFYCLTASPMDYATDYKKAYNLKYPFCTTDKTTLKTIIRSNPGLVLLKEGVVLGKWHFNDIPDTSFVKGNLMAQQVNKLRVKDNNKMIFLFITVFLLSVAVLALSKRKI